MRRTRARGGVLHRAALDVARAIQINSGLDVSTHCRGPHRMPNLDSDLRPDLNPTLRPGGADIVGAPTKH